MNTFKRISAIILALVMVLSLGVTVFATTTGPVVSDKTSYTITITPTDDQEHTYSAYQIFKGIVATEGTKGEDDYKVQLNQIEWGDAVVLTTETTETAGTAFLNALKADKTIGSKFAACKDADDVAAELAKFTNKSAEAYAFADVVAKFMEDNAESINYTAPSATGKRTKKEVGEGYNGVTINNVPAGYYVVMDTADIEGEGAKTRYILSVTDDVDVVSKSDSPSIDKKIVEDDKKVDTNEASLGEDVNYEITVPKIPAMDGYDNYHFVVSDTLSAGLTYNDDMEITIVDPDNGTLVKKLVEDEHYYVEFTIDGEKYTREQFDKLDKADYTGKEVNIRIVFKNFIQWKSEETNYVGKSIKINYSAKLNEKAVVGDPGNPNDVDLEFSNDPNWDGDGDWDDDNPDEPHGKTPNSKVITFTSGIEIIKTDENGEALTGAKFGIEGVTMTAVSVTGTHFVEWKENPEGVNPDVYYELKDGSFTTTAPTDANKAYYANYDGENTPKWMEEEYTQTKVTANSTTYGEAFVDGNGYLKFDVLGEGTYLVSELAAPEGYNAIKYSYLVQIRLDPSVTPNPDLEHETAKWEYRYVTVDKDFDLTKEGAIDEAFGNKEWTKYEDQQVRVELTVENKKGAQLPETGGMGTTIFYIVGGLMLVVALAVCVAKVMAPKAVSTKITAENI